MPTGLTASPFFRCLTVPFFFFAVNHASIISSKTLSFTSLSFCIFSTTVHACFIPEGLAVIYSVKQGINLTGSEMASINCLHSFLEQLCASLWHCSPVFFSKTSKTFTRRFLFLVAFSIKSNTATLSSIAKCFFPHACISIHKTIGEFANSLVNTPFYLICSMRDCFFETVCLDVLYKVVCVRVRVRVCVRARKRVCVYVCV